MAATDVKIVGICIESRHASNGTSPDIPNPKNTFFTNLDAPTLTAPAQTDVIGGVSSVGCSEFFLTS